MADTKPPSQPPDENTGQHIRVQLADLSVQIGQLGKKQEEQNVKLDQAIAVDKDDHAAMRTENSQHSTAVRSELSSFKEDVTQRFKGITITLDVMATSMNLKGQVDAAKYAAKINDDSDRRAQRRRVIYDWIGKIGIVVIGALAGIVTVGHC